jgi:hypothetical protein
MESAFGSCKSLYDDLALLINEYAHWKMLLNRFDAFF